MPWYGRSASLTPPPTKLTISISSPSHDRRRRRSAARLTTTKLRSTATRRGSISSLASRSVIVRGPGTAYASPFSVMVKVYSRSPSCDSASARPSECARASAASGCRPRAGAPAARPRVPALPPLPRSHGRSRPPSPRPNARAATRHAPRGRAARAASASARQPPHRQPQRVVLVEDVDGHADADAGRRRASRPADRAMPRAAERIGIDRPGSPSTSSDPATGHLP